MASFWLATFELNRPRAGPAAYPARAGGWAIEVVWEGDDRAVLLSRVDDPARPSQLECRVGFANGSKWCDLWRGRGFPLQDAEVAVSDRALQVRSAGFLADAAIDYAAGLLTVAPGMPPSKARPAGTREPLDVRYVQEQLAPDYAAPASRVRRKAVPWPAGRREVLERAPFDVAIRPATARLPSLAMFPEGTHRPARVWTGTLDLPGWPRALPRQRAQASDRLDYFVGSGFRFDDVEILGFRLDLGRLGIESEEAGSTNEAPDPLRRGRVDSFLDKMIEPLNFHRDKEHVSHFRYRPATRTVSLELLRYGRMRLKQRWRQITVDDFQSQHELLMRILVGRVDDDTGQAHDPATFVPAIFVDNPWSKALGREAQGFDKRLADFCIREGDRTVALRPDGRLSPDEPPRPLTAIEEIRLTESLGAGPGRLPLLGLDFPEDEGDESFDEIDLDLALGTSAFAPARWRQSDFDEVEFRRSFARRAIPESVAKLRSVQVSPIGEPRRRKAWASETTWITGTFAIDSGARVARPNGTAGLELWAQPSAPRPWRRLCALLGIPPKRSARLSFPAGSWYRMRCSMDLDIDDGLV